jgi:DnaJ-domain-containing protein 1
MSRIRLESHLDDRPHVFHRGCDRPGCVAEGEFRAPRARHQLNDYFWFCLEHVREYNAAWNYYAGMSEAEIEAEIRRDTTWQRPSWPLGSRMSPFQRNIRDHFGVFSGGEEVRQEMRRRPLSPEEQALRVFDLDPPFTLVSLKARYKELVKRHHPDANGGDKAAEEKLKVINQAYSTLKAAYFA